MSNVHPHADEPSPPRRPLFDVVRAGLGWGVIFALLLPFALAWLALTADAVGAGASASTGSGTPKPPRPRRGLQYSITAITSVLIVGAALGAFIVYARWRNHV